MLQPWWPNTTWQFKNLLSRLKSCLERNENDLVLNKISFSISNKLKPKDQLRARWSETMSLFARPRGRSETLLSAVSLFLLSSSPSSFSRLADILSGSAARQSIAH